MDNTVKIELRKNEALVLFDWLKRFNETGDCKFEDQAEERVLWDLEALLEKTMIAPFEGNYSKLLRGARNSIRDHE